jgi:hypothetical protein
MVGSDSERLNLSTLERREQLLPFLQWISSPAERQYIAGKLFEGVRSGPDSVSHVGEIGQIRVPIHDVLKTHGLTALQARAQQVQSVHPGAETIVLLNSAELARLKPFFVVRDRSQFRNQSYGVFSSSYPSGRCTSSGRCRESAARNMCCRPFCC